METAVCCIARNENRYIREFVDWNINTIGFSKVFIYDNGVDDEESPSVVLGDYVSNGKVEVIDWRGYRKKQQLLAYNDFLLKYRMLFDWMAFIDVDEFISFSESSGIMGIDEYLSLPVFDGVDEIKLQWLIYGDNGLIVPDYSIPIQERFKDYVHFGNRFPIANKWLKSLVRGHVADGSCFMDDDGLGPHGLCYKHSISSHKVVSGSGVELIVPSDTKTVAVNTNLDYNLCFIRHYMFKTITEYLGKLTTGYPDDVVVNDNTICWKLNGLFFAYNELTDEKAAVIRSRLSGWSEPEVCFNKN